MNRLRRFVYFVASYRLGALIVAALVLLPVFFAPYLGLPGKTFAYLFVVDVSESMNVRDVDAAAPDESRLDRAKAALIAALAALPCGSRVSIGLFAGSDTLVLFEPLEICRHYPAIEEVVQGIDWRMAWDGDSRIEAALTAAIREAGARGLNLVFVTDGDEMPHVVVPHLGDLLALAGKVKGQLAGVGGSEPKPVPHLDADNRIVGYLNAVDAVREGFYPNLSELVKQAPSATELEKSGALAEVQEYKSARNEDYLQQLGSAAGLGYIPLDSAQHLAAAVTDDALARQDRAERDMRIIFGLAAAVLVIIGWFEGMPDRKSGMPI